MKIVKETDTYIKIDWHGDGRTSKENKYLCIGGPFHLRKKAHSQVADRENSYVGYNCADNPRWVKPNFPRKVWIHKTILKIA